MTKRNLTPKIPGEPIQEAEILEQPATDVEQPVAQAGMAPDDPEQQSASMVITLPTADAARRPGDLPHASEIDPKSLNQPVLTQHGYVVPER